MRCRVARFSNRDYAASGLGKSLQTLSKHRHRGRRAVLRSVLGPEVRKLNNLLQQAGNDDNGFPPLWNDGTLLMRWSGAACYRCRSLAVVCQLFTRLFQSLPANWAASTSQLAKKWGQKWNVGQLPTRRPVSFS